MSLAGITDDKIEAFVRMPKRLVNPTAKKKSKYGHDEWEFEAVAIDDDVRFRVYKRQSQLDKDDFSCGITVKLAGGTELPLARYNGASHKHKNPIEKETFAFVYHIHKATQRYIDYKGGHGPDKYAQPTTRYTTLEHALGCLLEDYHIELPSGPNLFTV